MREIRTLRAMWRELETELRTLPNGHEGGNPGYGQPSVLRATAPVPDPTGISSLTAGIWSSIRRHSRLTP